MKLLSNSDDFLNLSAINEVPHDINSDNVDVQGTQPNSYTSTPCKSCSNLQTVPKTLVLIPRSVQIHRQALLKEETKNHSI